MPNSDYEPDSHLIIMEVIKALGGKSDSNGVCHGIGYMAMQAILTGDEGVKSYNNRIDLIGTHANKALNNEETQKELNEVNNNESLEEEELDLESEKIRVAAYKKYFDEKFLYWKKRAKAAGGYTNLFTTLTPEENHEWDSLLSIVGFAQGVDLYYDPKAFATDPNFKGLFAEEAKIQFQDANIALPLLKPESLDDANELEVKMNGKPCRRCNYYVNYSMLQNDINEMMTRLKKVKVNQPVSVVISSTDHTITVGFYPDNNEYTLMDPSHETNQAKIIKFTDARRLALEIARSFNDSVKPSQASPIMFIRRTYAATNDPEILQNIYAAFDLPEVLATAAIDCKNENYRDEQSGYSLLDFAIINNDLPLIEKLLKANVNLRNQNPLDGNTSLHLAIYKGNLDVIRMLMENFSPANVENHGGVTALQCAATKNDSGESLDLLLEYDPDLDLLAPDKNNLLHFSAYGNNTAGFKTLLETNKLNINAKNINNETPLHLCVRRGNVEMVKLLLERNADLTIKDTDGNTPLSLASKKLAKHPDNTAFRQIRDHLQTSAKKTKQISSKHGLSEKNLFSQSSSQKKKKTHADEKKNTDIPKLK